MATVYPEGPDKMQLYHMSISTSVKLYFQQRHKPVVSKKLPGLLGHRVVLHAKCFGAITCLSMQSADPIVVVAAATFTDTVAGWSV
jgi:hypothetical protein